MTSTANNTKANPMTQEEFELEIKTLLAELKGLEDYDSEELVYEAIADHLIRLTCNVPNLPAFSMLPRWLHWTQIIDDYGRIGTMGPSVAGASSSLSFLSCLHFLVLSFA